MPAPNSAADNRAAVAAERLTTVALINCLLREAPRWDPVAGERTAEAARLPLADGGALLVDLAHRSLVGHHRPLLPVRHHGPDGRVRDLDLAGLVALIGPALGDDGGNQLELAARIDDSRAMVATALAARGGEIDHLWGAGPLPFLAAEQSLLVGHPLHPTAKSRGEMDRSDRARFSPELGAHFALEWLAVSADHVAHDSALDLSAPEAVRRLLDGPPPPLAADELLLPIHPWQWPRLQDDPRVAALVASGALRHLGALGEPRWSATSSLRTVCRTDAPWQIKFSLDLRVTNSRRVLLAKELLRAVEGARLWQGPVGEHAARVAPDLVVLHDPAYLAVRDHDGAIIDDLSLLLREHRWPHERGDVSCLAALCQPHPDGGDARVAALARARAAADGVSETTAARAWFARYCDVLLVGLVRLYRDPGLCFEPHQQNTLLELEDGLPRRAVVRDSQGYFHRELAHPTLTAQTPGLGERSESIFPEALADERLVYYPFVNNALAVIGALGGAGCCDERLLLDDLRALLEAERARVARYPATLLDRVLDDARWPCKANLRTRLHDLDELVGDIATQSVYVTIANPLAP